MHAPRAGQQLLGWLTMAEGKGTLCVGSLVVKASQGLVHAVMPQLCQEPAHDVPAHLLACMHSWASAEARRLARRTPLDVRAW